MRKPITIHQQPDGWWVCRKGRLILVEKDKIEWIQERFLGVDHMSRWETLDELQTALHNMNEIELPY